MLPVVLVPRRASGAVHYMGSLAGSRLCGRSGVGKQVFKRCFTRGGGVRMARWRMDETTAFRQVVLANIKKGNSLDAAAMRSITWRLLAWENNYMVKGIMVRGKAGDLFSIGWDKSSIQAGNIDDALQTLSHFQQLVYVMATHRKPLISWLSGRVLGAGLGLGMSKYRFSTESSSFRVTGVSDGWGLDGGQSYVLSHLKIRGSTAFARYMALTGAVMSGLDMIASGLSTHYTDDYTVARMRHRFADIVMEPDELVDDIISEHAHLYYQLDHRPPVMPPDLVTLWEENDQERIRQSIERTRDSLMGMKEAEEEWERSGDKKERDEERSEEEEQEEEAEQQYTGKAREDDDEDEYVDDDEERQMPQRAVRVGKEFGTPPDVIPGLALEPRLLAEDEQVSELHTPRLDKGTFWWHRNFTDKMGASRRAYDDEAKARVEERLSAAAADALCEAVGGVDGFPEFIMYPPRRRLVDTEPSWLCGAGRTGNHSELFPDFLELLSAVEKCFKGHHLDEIMHDLEKDGSSFAQDCLRRMRNMPQLSLKIALKQINEAACMNFEEALRMEHRVLRRLLRSSGLAATADGDMDDLVESLFSPLRFEEEELELAEWLNRDRRLLPAWRASYKRATSTRGSGTW